MKNKSKPVARACPVTSASVGAAAEKSFAEDAKGIDAIIHSAALMLPNAPAHITHANVDGTANVVRFAQRHGIRRFMYVSAVSAIYRHKNVYGLSKVAAERLVAESGLEYTILRPTMMYGSNGGLHFQKLVSLIRRIPGVVPILGPGTALLQPVWVEDAAEAVELALAHPQAIRKSYDVSGATALTFNEFVDRLTHAIGVKRVKVHVPLMLCQVAAHTLTRLAGPSFFSPEALLGINEDASSDHTALAADCGYQPVTLDDGLAMVFGCEGVPPLPLDRDAALKPPQQPAQGPGADRRAIETTARLRHRRSG